MTYKVMTPLHGMPVRVAWLVHIRRVLYHPHAHMHLAGNVVQFAGCGSLHKHACSTQLGSGIWRPGAVCLLVVEYACGRASMRCSMQTVPCMMCDCAVCTQKGVTCTAGQCCWVSGLLTHAGHVAGGIMTLRQ